MVTSRIPREGEVGNPPPLMEAKINERRTYIMAKITTKSLATLNKGDLFTVLSFTGLQFGTYRVTAASKSKFKALNRKNEELIFNRADGMQVVEEGKEKWASRAVDLFIEAERKPEIIPETPEEHKARRKARRDARKAAKAAEAAKAAKAAAKGAKAPAKAKDEDDEDETPAPKKTSEKKATKGAAPVKKTDEADEDDEFDDETPAPKKAAAPAKAEPKKADKKADSKKAATPVKKADAEEDDEDWEDA